MFATTINLPLVNAMPTWLVWLAAALAMAGWVGLFLGPRRASWKVRLAVAPLRLVVGFLALSLLFAALSRGLTLQTTWNLTFAAFLAAVAIEVVVALYSLERQSLPTRLGQAVVALRACAVLLLVLVLLEPTYSWVIRHPDERFVAVILDDSASIDLTDPQAPLAEQLALVELIHGKPLANRWRVEEDTAALQELQRRLRDEKAWLAQPADSASEAASGSNDRRQALAKTVADAETTLKQLQASARKFPQRKKLPREAERNLERISAAIDRRLLPALAEVQAFAGGESDDASAVDDSLAEAIAAVEDVREQLTAAQPAIDSAFLASLPAEDQKLAKDIGQTPRRRLGAAALSASQNGKTSLLDELQDRYSVRFYRFAKDAQETTFKQWDEASPQAKGTTGNSKSTTPGDGRDGTDMAAALARVQSDIPSDQLAGVVLVGDGSHNADTPLEPLGQWLGARQIPVCSILAGSQVMTADAAVSSLTVPDRLQKDDRLVVKAGVRAAGMKGKTIEIVLKQGEEEIERKEVSIPSNRFDTTVELAHTPESIGLAEYEVAISPPEGERVTANNNRQFAVQVVDDPVRMLLVDDRRRWEYLYLRNLFAERDKSVRLQHLLLHPDWIEGAPTPEVVHASATREDGKSEATALPEKADDWSLFDVVILGDVSPEQFDKEQVDALLKFVEARGGALIVVAGRNHMPQQFADSPLAKILPISSGKDDAQLTVSDSGFRLAVAPGGESHAIMQLDEDGEANRQLWSKMPEMYLRVQGGKAQADAEVLAYAMPLDKVWEATPVGDPDDDENAEEAARQRENFIRENALITIRNHGAGRVCLLSFDSTWRFRYRKGDEHHHRFWGQVLRWATANKLPHGNDQVRLGTEKTMYAPSEPLEVRVSLRDKDGAPQSSEAVSIIVQQGEKKVTTQQLKAVANEPGMYEAKVDPLSKEGKYRVSLEVDDSAPQWLAESAADVQAEIVVAAPPSLEMLTLSADPSEMTRLAEQTGGTVTSPWNVQEILTHLSQPSGEIVEQKDFYLRHSWPVIFIVVSLFTMEWLLRKKGGLT